MRWAKINLNPNGLIFSSCPPCCCSAPQLMFCMFTTLQTSGCWKRAAVFLLNSVIHCVPRWGRVSSLIDYSSGLRRADVAVWSGCAAHMMLWGWDGGGLRDVMSTANPPLGSLCYFQRGGWGSFVTLFSGDKLHPVLAWPSWEQFSVILISLASRFSLTSLAEDPVTVRDTPTFCSQTCQIILAHIHSNKT